MVRTISVLVAMSLLVVAATGQQRAALDVVSCLC